jgi:hypothetical protein
MNAIWYFHFPSLPKTHKGTLCLASVHIRVKGLGSELAHKEGISQ